jgi:uncharacterized phage protein gp47/JayE
VPFSIPTREQLFQAWQGDYQSAQPDKNTSRGSDPYRLGRVVSGTVWGILGKVKWVVDKILPDSTVDWIQDRWGAIYNFPRKQPQGSTGTAALRVTGTIGNAVAVNAQLAHADGTLYHVSSASAVVGAGGYVDVDLVADSKGAATNKSAGEKLTFTGSPTPGPGIDADATLVLALSGGIDLETPDEYSPRLQQHIAEPQEGGSIADWQEWVLKQTGVKTAYEWAHRRGGGTMDVAALGPGTGAARVVSATVQTAIDDYIESVRPGNVRDFLVLTTIPVTQDVRATVVIDDDHKWDWNDAGVGYTITASDSTAKTITVPTAPAALIAGLRLQVNGEEARVTNRVGNVLTLTFDTDHDGNAVSWFTFTVNTGVDTRSAPRATWCGPLKFAIIDLFNSVGPARSTWSETSWTDQLKLSKLFAAITDVAGVDDATVINPGRQRLAAR